MVYLAKTLCTLGSGTNGWWTKQLGGETKDCVYYVRDGGIVERKYPSSIAKGIRPCVLIAD